MSAPNTDQRDFWSDDAGPIWVRRMAAMDAAFEPILDGVLSRAALQAGEKVLDIGCGAGTSTFAAAEQVGPTGDAIGLDISETLLKVANSAMPEDGPARFLLADAQVHSFETSSVDALISRFGVMFFEDTAAAFSNMATALRPAGRMVFATWGAIPENPFFTLPARVAKQVIGPVPKSDPDGPGPFALRDPQLVRQVLSQAGMTDIAVDEVTLDLTPVGDTRAIAEVMCDIGPAERALSNYSVGAEDRARLIDALASALETYQTPQGLRIPALINFFVASKAA